MGTNSGLLTAAPELQLSVCSSAAGDAGPHDWASLRQPLPLVPHPASGSYVFPQWIAGTSTLPRGKPLPWLLPTGVPERDEKEISPQRLYREWAIACVLPVTEVKAMSSLHWSELYSLERRYLPVDWSSAHERPVLGSSQSQITREHRHRIVCWMGEACALFHWSSLTFFTAVHAWDRFVTVVPYETQTADLARISASCLYFGAQMVESAADENVKSLDEFADMCPEVGSSNSLREVQAIIVDTLQGSNCVRRTAVDWLLLYLAVLQLAPSPGPELYEMLLANHLLDTLWDCALAVALIATTSGVALDGLPPSRWIAGTVLYVLETMCPALRADTTARERLITCVFHLPVHALEPFQTTILDPIIRPVSQYLQDQRNKMWDSDKGTTWKPAYWILRHKMLPNMDSCPVGLPSSKTVIDVSTRLRAAVLERSTPPAMYGSAVGPKSGAKEPRTVTAPSTTAATTKIRRSSQGMSAPGYPC